MVQAHMEVTAFHSYKLVSSHKLRMPNVLASTPECSSAAVGLCHPNYP